MFDFIDPQEPSLRKENWKDYVMAALAGQERAIASYLEGEPLPDRIQIVLVKSNRGSLTVRLIVGHHPIIMKLFASNGIQADLAYQREKGALMALRGTDVAPYILGFCDTRRFIMMRQVPAMDEDAAIDALGWEGYVREIGRWLARLDRVAPARPAHGNWASYLARYTDQLCIDNVPVAQDILSRIPLCGQSLSQGDSALSNVLFRPEGSAVGIDFEEARFRPRGWDFAMFFIALVGRRPENPEGILDALAAGFDDEHRGALMTEELCTVARLVLCLRANAFTIEEEF